MEIPESMKNAAVLAADVAMDKYSIEKASSGVPMFDAETESRCPFRMWQLN